MDAEDRAEANDLPGASDLLRRVLDHRPESHWLRVDLGRYLIQQGLAADAIPVLQAGVGRYPASHRAPAHLLLADALLATGEVEEARHHWRLVCCLGSGDTGLEEETREARGKLERYGGSTRAS
jgi:predicted Zn-dependent protease